MQAPRGSHSVSSHPIRVWIGLIFLILAGCAKEKPAIVRTEEFVNLMPHVSEGVGKHPKLREPLMGTVIGDALLIRKTREFIKLQDLKLPRKFSLHGSLAITTPAPAQHAPAFLLGKVPLVLHANAFSSQGKSHSAEVPLVFEATKEGSWMPFKLQLSFPFQPKAMTLWFDRKGAQSPELEGLLSILRLQAHWMANHEILPRKPRQVLLITTDTLRKDYLGCYGNLGVKTPRLDALARASALFEDCFAVSNVTNPSHTSILTSLYLKDHGVTDNFSRLSKEVPTLMDRLGAAGMRTAGFVSSFNFQPDKSDFNQRFDEFFPCDVYFERRAEDVNADLLPWLGKHANDDWFVWAHYFDVHMPYKPPAPYDRMFDEEGEEEIELPLDYGGSLRWFSGSNSLGHYKAQYKGELAYLDDQLGRVFDRLKELQRFDDVTIVVTSDHGESLGEHGIYCDHASLHDVVTRVPLLIKPASSAELDVAGRKLGGLVSSLDIYPTLLDILDLAPTEFMRGESLRKMMETGGSSARQRVFAEHDLNQQSSLRTPRYRFLRDNVDLEVYPEFAFEAERMSLFDLAIDPRADRNLAPTEAEQTEAFRRELEQFLEERKGFQSQAVENEDQIQGMESLGYTKGASDN